MADRLSLQAIFESILGSRNVYYQPPASVQLRYPAIVYSRNYIDNAFADNNVYKQEYEYVITVIDPNPDSQYVEAISRLPRIKYSRHYMSDNLNHDVFTLYY